MLKIYNSLTRRKEEFKPLVPGKIGVYVCGNTVYDYCHLGHARSMILFDVIVRYFRDQGFQVIYVRNITDIDDKIINRAQENNEPLQDLTARFIQAQREDEQALGLLSPDYEPRATECMAAMLELIEKLMDQGYAYIAGNGDVCFDVRRFHDYGQLSGRSIEKLKVGARIDPNDTKRDPLDFVLWKICKPGEPHWSSPWGEGRPGWHIECSAMSTTYLGQPFDIHGGGMDLKFPHHENEISQSEAAHGKPFAQLWMHVGLLQIEGMKMSKSLGNFITVREALQNYHPEELRFFMMQSLYRRPADFTESSLHEAKQRLKALYRPLLDLPLSSPQATQFPEFRRNFEKAMNDDFNTPESLKVLETMAVKINHLRAEGQIEHAVDVGQQLILLGNILGILQYSPEEFFKGFISQEQWRQIDLLRQARDSARAQKNWSEADRIRQELINMGLDVEDTLSGTRVSRQ